MSHSAAFVLPHLLHRCDVLPRKHMLLWYLQPEQLSLAELRKEYPQGSHSFEAAIAAHNALDALLKRQRQYWFGLPTNLHNGEPLQRTGA